MPLDERFGTVPVQNDNLDNFYKGLDRFNEGLRSLSIGRAMQEGQSMLDQAMAQQGDEMQRAAATRTVANHLAMALGAAGAQPAEIHALAQNMQPTAFEQAMTTHKMEADVQREHIAAQERIAAGNNENRLQIAEMKRLLDEEKQKVPPALISKIEPLKQLADSSDTLIKTANENPDWFNSVLGMKNAVPGLTNLRSKGVLKSMTDTLGITDPQEKDQFAEFAQRVGQNLVAYEQAHGGARAVASGSVQARLAQNMPALTDQPQQFLSKTLEARNLAAKEYNDMLDAFQQGGHIKAGRMSRMNFETRTPSQIMTGDSLQAARPGASEPPPIMQQQQPPNTFVGPATGTRWITK